MNIRSRLLCLSAAFALARSDSALSAPPVSGEHPANGALVALDTFGPTGTDAELRDTFARAAGALSQTGGILLVAPDQAVRLRLENNFQQCFREPEPPEMTRRWGSRPGFTVVEARPENTRVHLPQVNGLELIRDLRMESGQSLPHWSTDHAVKIRNRLVHGSNSYLDWLKEPVAAGSDRRFYVRTIRGIRPGQFLNLHGGPNYGGGVVRGLVKDIGYDPEKQCHYFVADTSLDHRADAIVHNKNNVGLLYLEQNAHADEQTYDIMLRRRQYGHGDTYMFFGWYDYMSDIHSAAGDENGTIYGAYTKSLVNNFTAEVERMDWNSRELRYLGAHNENTLANSRPLINMNTNKWITAGRLHIFSAGAPDGQVPHAAGRIRGDADCPWTEDVVGRFLAVTEPTERVPGTAIDNGPLRWFEVTGFLAHADGTKDLTVRRYWWGAKDRSTLLLYRAANYSRGDELRPLTYALAPGTYVYDVSKAVPGASLPSERTLYLAPYAHAGSAADFAPGDPVEQAIGPEPWKPVPFRIWMWDNVPGSWPSPVFDVANFGHTARHAAMVIRGGKTNADDLKDTKEQKPSWKNGIVFDSAAEVGIAFNADTTSAALLFAQPFREQPIVWRYGGADGRPAASARLTVNRQNGDFAFRGGDLRMEGSLVSAGGLSGSSTPSRNLRGKRVPVPEGVAEFIVSLPRAEPDADYAVFVEQSWLGHRAVTEQRSDGFTLAFDPPAPGGATLHWMLVR